MRHHLSNVLTLSLILAAGACGGAPQAPVGSPKEAPATDGTTAPAPAAAGAGLQIKLTTVYVDDQEKALRFYTDVLGFVEKDDYTNGSFRWLTVSAPTDLDGTALELALNDDPAAKAYQASRFAKSQPAIMFFTRDVKADYERIKARGAEFTMPPTEVNAGSVIAVLKDTCGNLVQITQLAE